MSIFRKPKQVKTGLKVLAYGGYGVGKSTFGLSFPKIAALDSEAGLSLYENNPNIVFIANTSSVSDVEDSIYEVEDMTDEIETLLIDSETKFYDSMQVSAMEVEEKRAKKKGGDVNDATVSVKGWGRIKLLTKKIQSLKIDLSAKGIHIVSISQMEDVKEKKGDNYVKVGDKPSMAKGIEFDYDIVIKLFTEKDSKGEEVYKGYIEKDRTGTFKRGHTVDNPSFECWKGYCNSKDNLDTRELKYSQDVSKDINNLQDSDDKIDAVITEFKTLMKDLTPSNQVKVQGKLKDLKIANPLKTDNITAMTELVEFMKVL